VDRLTGAWSVVLSEHPDPRGIRVGFLTTLPVVSTGQVTGFPPGLRPVQVGDTQADTAAGMGRGASHLQVNVDGVDWDLVTVHLKSKLLTFPGGRFSPRDEDERARFGAYALYRRAAEAATIRIHANDVLNEHGQDRPMIVLGDLNDTPQAATTQMLYGPPGSQFGTGGFDHPDRGDGSRLWNLAPLIPADHRFSRIFEGQRELIDHILISHALLGRVTSVDADVTGLPSIGVNPNARRGAPASDHAPVIARFT